MKATCFFLIYVKSVGLTTFLVFCLNGSFLPAYSTFHKHHSKGCIMAMALFALSPQIS